MVQTTGRVHCVADWYPQRRLEASDYCTQTENNLLANGHYSALWASLISVDALVVGACWVGRAA